MEINPESTCKINELASPGQTVIGPGNIRLNGTAVDIDCTTLSLGTSGETFKAIRLTTVADQDFASVADADGGGVDMTVTGVALGDVVLGVAANVDIGDDAQLIGAVTAANTVRVTLINHSGGAVDLAGTVDFNIVWMDLA